MNDQSSGENISEKEWKKKNDTRTCRAEWNNEMIFYLQVTDSSEAELSVVVGVVEKFSKKREKYWDKKERNLVRMPDSHYLAWPNASSHLVPTARSFLFHPSYIS